MHLNQFYAIYDKNGQIHRKEIDENKWLGIEKTNDKHT